MKPDLVVRNARLVDVRRIRTTDVAITNGRIAVLEGGTPPGETEIDAAGRIVTPGGVDSHVHLGQLSSKGDRTADDFWTGSRSAAHGGTTTIIPFAAQHRGMRLREVYEDARARANEQMTVDFGFHVIVTDPSVPDFDDDLAFLAAEGVVGIKLYLTYDRLRLDGEDAVDLMSRAAGLGLRVMVHAEDDGLVAWGRGRAVASGQLGARGHSVSHSRAAERAGVATAIAWAEETGATLVLAHLSVPDSVEQVGAARARGVAVYAETCPHYLILFEERMDADIETAAGFMCSPPLRSRAEAAELADHVRAGDVHIVASDHSPYTAEQKLPAGPDTPFTDVANGLPGIEVRMAVLRAVLGDDALAAMVEVACATPARMAGVYPRKGTVQTGSDADLVIWGDEPWTIGAADLHDAVGATPYEGLSVRSRPELVISRGEVIVGGGGEGLRAGRGRFLSA